MKKIYHFLGSVTFAIILIFFTALSVIVGTFIESWSDSHLYASQFTYSHPLFKLLLWLLCVNIVVAAIRRWPFSKRHIPFLTAHVGLVMILAGSLIKVYFGTQGSMLLVEGSGSENLIIPGSGVLTLDNPHGKHKEYAVAGQTLEKNSEVSLIHYFPHHEMTYSHWEVDEEADNVEKAVEKAFREGLVIRQINRADGSELHEKMAIETRLNFSPEKGFVHPELMISFSDYPSISIALDGPDSLLNQTDLYHPIRIELERAEKTYAIKDAEGHLYHLYFDPYGRVACNIFPRNQLSTIVVYDEGFGGYAVQSQFQRENATCAEKEERQFQALNEDLRLAFDKAERLTPPLELLRSCSGDDFCDQFLQFLVDWDRTKQWVYPLDAPPLPMIEEINWGLIPKKQLISAYWSYLMLAQMEQEEDFLEKAPWKYLCVSHKQPEQSLIEQLFSIPDSLPEEIDLHLSAQEATRLVSILLRAHGLHLRTLMHSVQTQPELITLETPLTPKFQPLPPLKKLEDNRPMLAVEIKGDTIPIGYDPYNTALKWPILNGRYLIHYRPQYQQIPYHVRLREGRQINYPDSRQPFSYEGDVIISGDDFEEEVTLSMNHVYQTWDGYRFYLANVTPNDGRSAKKVQLIVNHDPARYLLTYPGGAIVSLGILLLFWMRPYSRKSQH